MGTPQATNGDGGLVALRAALRVVLAVRSLHIRDEWSGLNPTAPWVTSYTLERDHVDDFVGAALFAAGNSAKVARRLDVPGTAMRLFLERLATVRPVAGEYTPCFTHTDDYPKVEIHLETSADGVTFYSTSQGRHHTLWALTHAGATFVVPSARPAQALARLRQHLHREILDALIADLEREMGSEGW